MMVVNPYNKIIGSKRGSFVKGIDECFEDRIKPEHG
jgi:hypothetical protein